ncbi:MAG: 16S rRNA (guanine(966)-N(2))-methyltransferase RsmD [Gammaproteobacteria bacterium]|nr:16S rRNA (guanine(966)-N(2))-methyltransferase RsmD [Gammaproteobacteria bacterium]
MVASSKRGSCRIIGGKWRGRKISFDDAEGLRPTTDRIRETVFNWLQAYISQSHCLDCFAGSGVLGFEALSRGADDVVFIEQNIKTVNALKNNIRLLDAGNASIFHRDTLVWLQSASTNTKLKQHFDLVFLDPPFRSDLLSRSCFLLDSSGCLAEDAIIYAEHSVDATVDFPEHWFCLKQKSSGQVSYKLFEKRG